MNDETPTGLKELSLGLPVLRSLTGTAGPFMAAWGGPLAIGGGILGGFLSERAHDRAESARRNQMREYFRSIGPEASYQQLRQMLDGQYADMRGDFPDTPSPYDRPAGAPGNRFSTAGVMYGLMGDAYKDTWGNDPRYAHQYQDLTARDHRNADEASRLVGLWGASGGSPQAFGQNPGVLPVGYENRPRETTEQGATEPEVFRSGVTTPRFRDTEGTGYTEQVPVTASDDPLSLTPADRWRLTNWMGGAGRMATLGQQIGSDGRMRPISRPLAELGEGGNQ